MLETGCAVVMPTAGGGSGLLATTGGAVVAAAGEIPAVGTGAAVTTTIGRSAVSA
jgi:hypothetical protein